MRNAIKVATQIYRYNAKPIAHTSTQTRKGAERQRTDQEKMRIPNERDTFVLGFRLLNATQLQINNKTKTRFDCIEL